MDKRGDLTLKKDLGPLLIHPVRQRIIQYLLLHPHATVGDIAAECTDIPRPTLYRHVKTLLDAGLLTAVQRRQVRGAVETTYTLAQPDPEDMTLSDGAALIQSTLMSIAASFARYFARPDAEPMRDMLSVSSATLLLSDEEFADFSNRIGQVYNDVIMNKPGPGRKPRCITIISAPPESGQKGE